MTVTTERTRVRTPTGSYGSEKTARRSLGFSGKENVQTLSYEGEVKVDLKTFLFVSNTCHVDVHLNFI